MTVEKLELKSNPGATLTAYLLDTSREMPNMTDRPAVLGIPGGGYYMCSDREAEPIAMAFAVHGYNTFVLRYTVGEGKDFKMPLADAEEALALIRERAEEWRVIKAKLAAIGFSAGAHLAAAVRSQKHHKRHERKDYYRKPYVHRREHDESRDYFYHGHQDVLRTVMGELGYVKQVVCYSRHELAYLRVVIE